MFRLVEVHAGPILGKATAGTKLIRFGFEGGRALKLAETFHLFISEMVDEPKFAKTRLGHWTSIDGLAWQRQSTLVESSGEFEGRDPRAAIFLPQPVFDERADRWNLFYAAFRSAPNRMDQWLLNHDGRIWRAVSRAPGPQGIGGPYDDVGVVLQRVAESDPWEGLQGVDSFFPYQVGDNWYAFYGSAQTQNWPCQFWGVGLATSAALAGPWRRCSELNPVRIDEPFMENPIVTRFADGRYAMVYDAVLKGRAIGCAISSDGIHWPAGHRVELAGPEFGWLRQTRTPLGLIPRDADRQTFDVFYTGEEQDGYRCISRVTLQWVD